MISDVGEYLAEVGWVPGSACCTKQTTASSECNTVITWCIVAGIILSTKMLVSCKKEATEHYMQPLIW